MIHMEILKKTVPPKKFVAHPKTKPLYAVNELVPLTDRSIFYTILVYFLARTQIFRSSM